MGDTPSNSSDGLFPRSSLCHRLSPAITKGRHHSNRATPATRFGAHIRLGVPLLDDVLRCYTHRSGGEGPVELLTPARLGPFRRHGGVCHPFAFSEQKGATMSMVRMIVGGVDTHADTYVAAVVDANGGVLGIESFPADESGFEALLGWLSSHGEIQMVGVEGTGSWGVGLARFLHHHEVSVVEVDRPNGQDRRRVGKSDPTDALSAARAALSGSASVIPKTRNGPVEQIRILLVARRSARSQRIETLNQLRHLIYTGPEEVRSMFKDRYKTGLVTEVAKLRPRKGSDQVLYTTMVTMRGLARRIQSLNSEIKDLDSVLTELVSDTAPSLVGLYGVGTDTAATLLVTAGDNPDRLRSERSWVHLCGVSPIPAGSGKTSGRHRLNRGGNRQANAALYRIVLTRMSSDARTRTYVTRRRAEGRNTAEIMRCLKRYVARETFKHIHHIT